MRTTAFASLLLLAVTAYAQTAFTVGTATAKPGEVAYGAIDVPAGVDAGTSIPVAVINGAHDGPVIAFVAGSHGTEYASIVALTRLIARIDPKTLIGKAIVVPLVNVASFQQMTVHLNPIDHKGMNGNWPGDPKGTQTMRALAILADQVVKRAGAIVDLHGGDLDEELVPYSYWFRTGNKTLDTIDRGLALDFGLKRVIIEDLDMKNPSSAKTLSGYALSLGKEVVVAEAGHNGTVEAKDVNALIDGCLNVLGALKMIQHKPHRAENPQWVGSGSRIQAAAPGMWYPAVPGGAAVQKGELLGKMPAYLGRPVSEVHSPLAGIVTFIRPVPSTWKGATLANVAPIVKP